MPCDCELDLERRWVKVRASGLLTYDDVMAARRKFTSDPAFRPDFYQLYDVRDVTRVALTASQIAELATAPIFGHRSRRACVSANGETFGVARMFQDFRKLNAGKEQIELFISVEDAEAWLAG
jgi:hypothetical protein